MSGVDIAIVAAVLLSGLLGLKRGLLDEAMSLLTLVGAFLMTFIFSSRFASLLPEDTITSPGARAAVSAVVLFTGTIVVGHLIAWLLSQLLARHTHSRLDRTLGMVFGLLRGVFLVSVLVLLSGLQADIRLQPFWQSSQLLPYFQEVAEEIHQHLPASLARHFSF